MDLFFFFSVFEKCAHGHIIWHFLSVLRETEDGYNSHSALWKILRKKKKSNSGTENVKSDSMFSGNYKLKSILVKIIF